MFNETFYKQYCNLKVRVAPFRQKTDFETVKTVAAVDALADRAELLTHGSNESRFGWSDRLKLNTEPLYQLARKLLEKMERGEQPLRGYFAEPGCALIDHCFIEQDGRLHVFYNRGLIAYDWPERFVDTLGHAVTDDLVNWEILPLALTATPDTYDNHQVWSPGIVKKDGKYYLFYSGINYHIAQATCLALSDDLYHFEKYAGNPVQTPGPWAGWSAEKWSNCRDAMPFYDDPATGGDGKYYLYYCTSTNEPDGSYHTAEGVASSEDLYHWTDEGCFLLEQCRKPPESPYVIKHNGTYYLFYTNCERKGTYYATSDRPTGRWKEMGEVIPAVSCSEVFQFRGKWYISVCANQGCGMCLLGIYHFFWNDDGTVRAGNQLITEPIKD